LSRKQEKKGFLMKPVLVIELIMPEGSAFALVANARFCLERAGQVEKSTELGQRFYALDENTAHMYDDAKRLVEEYCDVTWLNTPEKVREFNAREALAKSEQ